jgi:protein-S-isoprenylcysteine O-methyltransferase Ste14
MSFSFWIILLAILIYGFVHSLLASLRLKAIARHWFGPVANRWFRLFYNLVAGLTLLPIVLLPVVMVDKPLYSIRSPWIILTGILQVVALVILGVGVAQTGLLSFLGVQQLFGVVEEKPSKLVVDGLYRYVRHPLYTAGLVIIWLMPVMTCNLLALNIGLTLYILIGAVFEERKLLREYGEVYADYQKHTPMLIPGLRFKK